MSYEKDILKINKKINKIEKKIMDDFIPKIIKYIKKINIYYECFGSIYIEIDVAKHHVKLFYPKKVKRNIIYYDVKIVKVKNYVHKYKDIEEEINIRKRIINECNNKYIDFKFYETNKNMIMIETNVYHP